MDAESIQDLFQELGPVRIRRMFGGQGIYAGERMFALEAGGSLFLKADDVNRPLLQEAGSRPFVYGANGRTATMSYWSMPEDGLDDPSAAAHWGRLAVEAARRSAAGKPAGDSGPRKSSGAKASKPKVSKTKSRA
jgi:DNA transformation protein and related proteins